MQIFSYFKIASLTLGGDWLDFYFVHAHGAKHPKVPGHLKAEVEDGIKGLDEIDKFFPKIPKRYVMGNHEYRFERHLVNKAPELFDLLDLESLLKFHERPLWKITPYHKEQKFKFPGTDLYVRHEPPKGAMTTWAKTMGHSCIVNHIHRRVEMDHVDMTGKTVSVRCPGWLGDKRYEQVFGYVPDWYMWQLGASIIWIDDQTGEWFYDGFEIKNNRSFFNGKLFKA